MHVNHFRQLQRVVEYMTITVHMHASQGNLRLNQASIYFNQGNYFAGKSKVAPSLCTIRASYPMPMACIALVPYVYVLHIYTHTYVVNVGIVPHLVHYIYMCQCCA